MKKEDADESGIDISIFQSLFDNVVNGVFLLHNGKIVYSNPKFGEILGFNPEQIQDSKISLITHILEPESEEVALKQLSDLQLGKKETDLGVFRFIRPNGETAILEVIGNKVVMDEREFVLSYITDVTEEQLSRERLARERRVYSIIANAALSTASIKEVSEQVLKGIIDALEFDIGTFRVFNEEDGTLDLMTVIGLEQGGTKDRVDLGDPSMLVARTARTKQPMFTKDIEESQESSDRLSRAKELSIRSLIFWPVIGSDEKLIGVINVAAHRRIDLGKEEKSFFENLAGMLTTIIEHKRAEQQLRETQERFLAFADNMPGPLFIKDDKSRVLFINRFMRSRPNQESWEKMTPKQLFRKSRAETISIEDKKVLEEGPLDRIQSFLNEDGASRTYRSHKFPIVREGLPPLIGGFSIDITEQIEAEKEREEARARAEFFNDLMAHDLNNMHQGIMASLELIMSNDECAEDIKDIAESALQQVKRSVSLINNVKKFSQLNKEELALEKTDPATSLVAAMEIVKQSFPSRDITIKTNLTAGTYCIMANEFLQDVFYNLLHNSVKNTKDDPVRIHVKSSLVEDGEYLCIEVEDWGIGIKDRLKESILLSLDDRVRRVSGVGLTLVKQIVDFFRGYVCVEDRVKGDYTKGTRFLVHLPNGC